MKKSDLGKFNLPENPGVYFFRGKKGKILYIGKATSLKDRVKSYFARDILMTRSPLIAKMLEEAEKITFTKTDSVIEALLLEAGEIKKHQPPYNSKEKDDKSYNYVVITKEAFPRVLLERGRNLEADDRKFKAIFGPFPHGSELKEALKIVRKLFPYRDKCKIGQPRPCFNAQIGLCPGVCSGNISKTDYGKIIRHLILFFDGKKKALVSALRREMKILAKSQKFESAEMVKRQIFALEHIQDIALIKKGISRDQNSFRIEAYDVAHTSGTDVVSVMTVVEDGELAKNEYRKFKIHTDKNDDVANLKETLTRRFKHLEWRRPNLIVVDGGAGQINAAKRIIKSLGHDIAVASVVKDERHRAREILGEKEYHREILLANSEAHRFAIGYHRRLRGKSFKI
ncbi:MAG: GIY-YIG nuclease family protein [Patescibacteria group bacterium]